MTVHIVTDSTADIPAAITGALGITVVPLSVIFGDEAYLDRIDISEEEFYHRLTTGSITPRTSQPSPAQFEEVYRRLTANGDSVLSVHISGKLSGTLNSARTAAESLDLPDRIRIVDTELVSLALGIVAIRCAKAAQRGVPLDELETMAQATSHLTEILFSPGTLTYLQRGGRIGRARALLGTLLSVKPILRIVEGEVRPLEQVRTRARAIERLYQWAGERPEVSALAVLSSPPHEDADVLTKRLGERFPGITIYRGVLGPVVGTHGGPGLAGIARYVGPAID